MVVRHLHGSQGFRKIHARGQKTVYVVHISKKVRRVVVRDRTHVREQSVDNNAVRVYISLQAPPHFGVVTRVEHVFVERHNGTAGFHRKQHHFVHDDALPVKPVQHKVLLHIQLRLVAAGTFAADA